MTKRLSDSPSAPWSRVLRPILVLVVMASVLAAGDRHAEAVRIPVTLADQRPVQTGPVNPGFPIDYLGVVWETPGTRPDHHGGPEPHGSVRFLTDGLWGPWIPLVPDGAEAVGQWGSALVSGGDAEGYQIRGVPPLAESPRAVAINTTDGPLVTVGERPQLSALSSCLSRADWGADETLRDTFPWPETFEPVQVMTVHHTVTANDDPDPAGTVRAIYRYHAIDREWGDIAYQYLIDEAGRVYEGRWSGSESLSCVSSGGDGTDFAHNADGDLVTGGHTAYYNQGNLGVALLGDFTSVQPKEAARAALESALAELAIRHGLDPLRMVDYYNDVWGTSVTIETISAHRDWPSPAGDTACPGNAFYPRMPDVRANVADLMGLAVSTISVADVGYSTSGGRGDKDLTIDILLDPAVPGAEVDVEVTWDDAMILSDTVTTDDTGTASIFIRNHQSGCYATAVTGIHGTGRLFDGAIPDNGYGCDTSTTTTSSTTTTTTTTTTSAGSVAVYTIEPDTVVSGGSLSATVTGSGFTDGAVVSFSGGEGPAPEAISTFVSDAEIDVEITTKEGGPPRDRRWDVTVTNPDGSSGMLPDGLLVDATP